MDMVRLENSR